MLALLPLLLQISVVVANAAVKDPKVMSASKLVETAEREMRVGDVDVALKLLGDALLLDPAPKTYYARYKANLKKNRMPSAIDDLSSAIAADPGYSMALLQRGNLLLVTGRCDEAVADYEAALALDPGKRDAVARLPRARECAAAVARGHQAAAAGHHEAARAAFSEALTPDHATQAPALLLARARCAAALHDLDAALADAAKVLKLEPNNPPAYALRGETLYVRGDYVTARAHFSECTRYDPEFTACKDGFRRVKALIKAKEAGEAAEARGAWEEAAAAWLGGIALDPHHGVWQREARPALTRALLKLKATERAIAAGEACLALDDNLALCHMLLGEALLAADRFEDAARHGRRAAELDRNNGEYGAFQQRADAALRRSKTKDYYKILKIARDADDGEIKRAYRAAAKECHPDKFTDPVRSLCFAISQALVPPHCRRLRVVPIRAHSYSSHPPPPRRSQIEKEAAEKLFRDVAEAAEVLSDSDKRGRYDRGEDVTGNPQQQQQGHPFQQGGFPFPGGFGGFHFRQG